MAATKGTWLAVGVIAVMVSVSALLLGLIGHDIPDVPHNHVINATSTVGEGMVYPGSTYAVVHISDPTECMRECKEDDRCGSWVSGSCVGIHSPFHKGVCYLRLPGRGMAYRTLCSFYGGRISSRVLVPNASAPFASVLGEVSGVGNLVKLKARTLAKNEVRYARGHAGLALENSHSRVGRMHGTVLSALTGLPLQGADVELLDGPAGFEVGVLKTDMAGNFSFSAIPCGRWKLWVHRARFDGNVREILVGASSPDAQHIVLAPLLTSAAEALWVVTWRASVIGVESALYFGSHCEVSSRLSICRDRNAVARLNGNSASTWGPQSIHVSDVSDHTLRFFVGPPWGSSTQPTSISDTLQAAQPKVELYFGGKKTEIRYVPRISVVGHRGWHVCDINGRTNTVITPQMENDGSWR